MTCYDLDPERSAFDLPLDMANDRIAALRGEARRSHLADEGPPVGAIQRVRRGLGLRLIALGSALVADRRPRPLAR